MLCDGYCSYCHRASTVHQVQIIRDGEPFLKIDDNTMNTEEKI